MVKEGCIELHNAIAELIVTKKVNAQDAVYTLELLVHEIISGELASVAPAKLSDKAPPAMG